MPCRNRLRQVLDVFDDRGHLTRSELTTAIAESSCSQPGHTLGLRTFMGGLARPDGDSALILEPVGKQWLLDHAKPSTSWSEDASPSQAPLRQWQREALDAWAEHGRHGVVEAVTGTGKSRVGVEAVREALADDFNVVVIAPTVDLTDQWVKVLSQNGIANVGRCGDGRRATFAEHAVLVGTVHSFYEAPPVRADGRVLVIADECHRYGADKWRRALDPSYRRRLGLTATFERNDDGLEHLLNYFGGSPVFTIDFRRAIDDGVVARYDVQLIGVDLDAHEQAQYDEAREAAGEARLQLLAAGVSAEPYGTFMKEVADISQGDVDPALEDTARRFLANMSHSIEVMTSAAAKLAVASALASRLATAGGALVFTRRISAATDLANALNRGGASVRALHSELTRSERRDLLAALRAGSIDGLVAPTVLDEGIDVPDVDLAVVMSGSRSRRQMIQRMGRVLRLKRDGRRATFIVVYARGTAEDLTRSSGDETCLDLIVETAESVTHATIQNGRLTESSQPVRLRTLPRVPPTTEPDEELIAEPALRIDPRTLPMTRHALQQYVHAHGLEEPDAESDLRTALADFLTLTQPVPTTRVHGGYILKHAGFRLVVTESQFVDYHSFRRDAYTWPDLRDLAEPLGPEEFTAAHAPQPDVRMPLTAVQAVARTLHPDEPLTESSVANARQELAEDLNSAVEVEPVALGTVVRGERIDWTLSADQTTVLSAEPRATNAVREPDEPEAPPTMPRRESLVDDLERLANLFERGVLTDEEFTAAKAKLLG